MKGITPVRLAGHVMPWPVSSCATSHRNFSRITSEPVRGRSDKSSLAHERRTTAVLTATGISNCPALGGPRKERCRRMAHREQDGETSTNDGRKCLPVPAGPSSWPPWRRPRLIPPPKPPRLSGAGGGMAYQQPGCDSHVAPTQKCRIEDLQHDDEDHPSRLPNH